MRKQLKRLIVGIVASFVIFGAFTAYAWDPSSDQRGWVDSMVWRRGFVTGPSWALTIDGWACLHPKHNMYSTPTNVAVYQYTTTGWQQLTLSGSQVVYRPDVVAAGACSSFYSGFSVGAFPLTTSNAYNYFKVEWLGGFVAITLENPGPAVIIY